jgi:hypothetical protein
MDLSDIENLVKYKSTVSFCCEYRMYFIVEDKIMLDILLTGLPILLENTPYITAATLTNYENKTELGCPKSNADLRNTRLTFGVTKKEVAAVMYGVFSNRIGSPVRRISSIILSSTIKYIRYS